MTLARIQMRRDTSAAWATSNPVLGEGEMGLDVTVMRIKVGDGSTPWSGLPFAVLPGEKGDPGAKGDPGPQGLPGMNAVPADEAVATYAATPGSATNTALSATFVQFRAFDGTPVSTGSVVVITLTEDGTDIHDITVEEA